MLFWGGRNTFICYHRGGVLEDFVLLISKEFAYAGTGAEGREAVPCLWSPAPEVLLRCKIWVEDLQV